MSLSEQLQARWGEPSQRSPTLGQEASACGSANAAGDARPVAKRARREMNAVVVFIFVDGWVVNKIVVLMCECWMSLRMGIVCYQMDCMIFL